MKGAWIIFLISVSVSLLAQSTFTTHEPIPGMRVRFKALNTSPNVPNGLYAIHYDGRQQLKGNAIQGYRHGIWQRFYDNGKVAVQGQYINDKKHGKWEAFTNEGTLSASWVYDHGTPVGQWSAWDNGSKSLDIIHAGLGNRKQFVTYYPGGKVAVNVTYKKQHGFRKRIENHYYRNGQLFSFRQYRNDTLHGECITYHPSGAIWEKCTYELGRLIEVSEMRAYTGQPLRIGDFSAGTGNLNRYYSNGLIYERSTWREGVRHDSIRLYDNAIVAVEGTYFEGEPTGTWRINDHYHHLQKVLDFESQKPLVWCREFTEANLQESISGTFDRAGMRQGPWKRYNYYRELVDLKHYKDDLLDGRYAEYSGELLLQEGYYRAGQKVGHWDYFNGWGKHMFEEDFFRNVNFNKEKAAAFDPSLFRITPTFKRLSRLQYNEQVQAAITGRPLPINSTPERVRVWRDEAFYVDRNVVFPDPTKDKFKRPFEWRFIPFEQPNRFDFIPEFIPPRFDGGDRTLNDVLLHSMKYTRQALELGIHGEMRVQLAINELGMVSEVVILRGLGHGLDKSTNVLLRRLPPFQPATFQGMPVPCFIVASLYY